MDLPLSDLVAEIKKKKKKKKLFIYLAVSGLSSSLWDLSGARGLSTCSTQA